MPYVAGYFGKGYRGTPIQFPDESPASKRRRIEVIADEATALGLPEVSGVLHGIEDLFEGGPSYTPSSQTHPLHAARLARLSAASRRLTTSHRPPVRSKKMARFRRRRFRRRGRRSFTSKVKGTILAMKETKRQLDSTAQATFSAGDGTTRTLYIASPIGNVSQGTSGDDAIGDKLHIKALWLRGRISLDQTTNTLRVRILCIATRQFADLPLGWTTYGNTTTATAFPTQTPADGETNIRIFETSAAEIAAQPSAPYVGNATGIDIIDSDLVRVVGGREYVLGTDNANYFQNVDIYVPIGHSVFNYSEFDAPPTDQLRSFKSMNYFWIMQVFSNSNANNILVAQDILGTFDIITYFKNMQ